LVSSGGFSFWATTYSTMVLLELLSQSRPVAGNDRQCYFNKIALSQRRSRKKLLR